MQIFIFLKNIYNFDEIDDKNVLLFLEMFYIKIPRKFLSGEMKI